MYTTYSTKEPKNVPISLSLLHELDYKMTVLLTNNKNKQIGTRRSFSETNLYKRKMPKQLSINNIPLSIPL